jgi:hypothetical protein
MNLIAPLLKKTWLLGFGVTTGLGFVLFGAIWPASGPLQPIRFNHALHVSNGLTCDDCHAGARTHERATLPVLDTCLTCHREPLTKSPEEEKIRTFDRASQEIPWLQVTHVPRHVYFSHQRHVSLGGLKCSECHGTMEKRTEPPTRSFRPMTMEACIGCHQQRNVRHDCNDCHR